MPFPSGRGLRSQIERLQRIANLGLELPLEAARLSAFCLLLSFPPVMPHPDIHSQRHLKRISAFHLGFDNLARLI